MAFCSNCGKPLANGAKFCAECGAPAASAENDGSKRVQKFVGEIKKCPHCGSVIEGFTAQCPQCGMELNKKVSDEIAKFKKELDGLEDVITVESIQDKKETKKWWTDWSKSLKFGYVVLNIFTYGIPVILHFVISAIKQFRPKKLTPAETRKQQCIQSFVVSNNKEEIMEFLVFAKGNRDADVVNTIDKKWKVVWNNKCKQIITKARALYQNDTKFQEFLNVEKEACDKFSQSMRIKNLVPVGTLAWAIVLLIATCSIKGAGVGVKIASPEKTVPASGITLQKELAHQIRITGDVKFVVDDEDDYQVRVTIPIEGLNELSYDEVFDNRVEQFIEEKGVSKVDAEIGLKTNSLIFKGSDTYRFTGNISAEKTLSQIRLGETAIIEFSLLPEWPFASTKEKKKTANDIMKRSTYILGLKKRQRVEVPAGSEGQYITIGE